MDKLKWHKHTFFFILALHDDDKQTTDWIQEKENDDLCEKLIGFRVKLKWKVNGTINNNKSSNKQVANKQICCQRNVG